MPLIAAAAYKPDVADYEGSSTKNILNVTPQGDGYGPFPSFAKYTQALGATCRGAFYALNTDGSVVTFAATSTKLYKQNNTTLAFTDVSLGGGTYSALAIGAQWQFAQTGTLVFATQANAVLQVFDLSSSTAFANGAGSPPQAAYITVIGGFLVLSGLLSQPYRIFWSGLESFNASASWTPGTNSCDFQDFPDGGIVRGVGGGDQSGVVFQDQAIRAMAYVPGSPLIFQIEKIADGIGLLAPYSIIRRGATLYFYATQGFYSVTGTTLTPIGAEKVNRFTSRDLDNTNLQLFMGTADPQSARIYWAYKSVNGTAGQYDKLLGYDPLLERFFPISVSGEFLLGISQSGITLESLDPVAPTPLTITGAANNGSGKVRLTLLAESNANFAIAGQNSITVYGVTGTTEANGTFPISQVTIVNSTHIDLTGVAFVNAYVSGGQIGGSVDALTLSLDDYPTSFEPQLGQFDTTASLGFFSGSNLEATIDSAEQGAGDQRLTVRGFRPISDAPSIFGRIVYRDTQQAAATVGTEIAISSRTGRIDMMRDARYVRFRNRIPAGTTWTFFAGVEPDASAGSTL
ncbi:MAG TPA: hypothetical protein VJ846_10870 [Sphingomicrobium sp.]|nr:hypothetical protein [Sphingomicrobium sp.]